MDLRDFARQRLEGIDGADRARYTRPVNSIYKRFPTVEVVQRATDGELRRGADYGGLGASGLAYLRELVGQSGESAPGTDQQMEIAQ